MHSPVLKVLSVSLDSKLDRNLFHGYRCFSHKKTNVMIEERSQKAISPEKQLQKCMVHVDSNNNTGIKPQYQSGSE